VVGGWAWLTGVTFAVIGRASEYVSLQFGDRDVGYNVGDINC